MATIKEMRKDLTNNDRKKYPNTSKIIDEIEKIEKGEKSKLFKKA